MYLICNKRKCLNGSSDIRFLYLIISVLGFKKKSVNKSGAISGFIIGFFITLSSYCFLACLMTFFILGSKVTKFKSSEKKKFEKDFKEGTIVCLEQFS